MTYMPHEAYSLLPCSATCIPVAVALYLLTGVAQVRPEERGVVRRFGAVVARPGPGLWVGLPWGVDRIDRVPVRTARQLNVGFMPTRPTPRCRRRPASC